MPQHAQTNSQPSASANQAEIRVLESAIKCFAAKGYNGTSIREIVQIAGVTTPVLYYYFKNKEDLFCHIVEIQFDEVCRQIEWIQENIPGCRDRLLALVQLSFDSATEAPDMVRMLLQYFFSSDDHLRIDKVKFAEERLAGIELIMRQGIENGEIAGTDPEMLAIAFSGIMDTYVMGTTIKDDLPLTHETAESLVNLFMNGVAPRNADA